MYSVMNVCSTVMGQFMHPFDSTRRKGVDGSFTPIFDPTMEVTYYYTIMTFIIGRDNLIVV